jgi:nucleotide-binding universal stress UspA family protein
MIESILIATDGSDAAHVAERWGAALAAKLRTRCYGMTVIEERATLGLRADSLGIPPGPVDAVENFLKVRADAACRRPARTRACTRRPARAPARRDAGRPHPHAP